MAKANTSDLEGKGEAHAEPRRRTLKLDRPDNGSGGGPAALSVPARGWDGQPAVERHRQPLRQVLIALGPSPSWEALQSHRTPSTRDSLRAPAANLPQPHPSTFLGHYPHTSPATPPWLHLWSPRPLKPWGHMLPTTLSAHSSGLFLSCRPSDW